MQLCPGTPWAKHTRYGFALGDFRGEGCSYPLSRLQSVQETLARCGPCSKPLSARVLLRVGRGLAPSKGKPVPRTTQPQHHLHSRQAPVHKSTWALVENSSLATQARGP